MVIFQTRKIDINKFRENPEKSLMDLVDALNENAGPDTLKWRWTNVFNNDESSPDYNPDGDLGRFVLVFNPTSENGTEPTGP